MEQGKLHITIGSTPQTQQEGEITKIVFENDLRMVKAALLYADQATLCSVASSTLLELVALRDLPPEQRVGFFRTVLNWMPNDKNVQMINSMISLVEQFNDAGFNKILADSLADSWKLVKDYVNTFVNDAGGDGILRAIESGLLQVHPFDAALRRALQESEHRKFILEYISVVGVSVSNAQTYPLFDEDTSEVIRAGIQAGIFSVSTAAVARGKETGLAADLLARLPVFPLATVKEVLDIRRELEPHLKRFRSAMIKFSEGIKNAAWDESFPFDAEQVFRRDIEPAVETIEAEVKANRFIVDLTRRFADKSLIATGGSAIALTMSNLSLPAIASLAIGALVGGGTAAYDTYKEWSKKSRENQQNNLFFYYKAKDSLLTRKYDYKSDKV
jgi:hypothetical protein